jgi:hypothetical protein
MARFDPKDYIEVKDRIVRFWSDHPQGSIVTECLYVDDAVVRMKAEVYHSNVDPNAKPLGTGHAEEYRVTEEEVKEDWKKKNDPNYTSAVENCETSAVGRALAMAGYEVSKSVASRQEMEKVQRQQKARERELQNSSNESLDNSQEAATVVVSDESNGHLNADEARKLAGNIKGTGIEMSAVELKLVAMGIEKSNTLSETLRTMTKEQAQDLYSWVVGNQN